MLISFCFVTRKGASRAEWMKAVSFDPKPAHIRFVVFALAVFALCAPLSSYGRTTVQMDDYPLVKLRTLDKMTARTVAFEARVGRTVKFGSLYIRIQACRKAPPVEAPESAAFLQIWESEDEQDANWVFSGWMFASSPALSPMDHPVYDVWVLDCLGDAEEQSDIAAADDDQDVIDLDDVDPGTDDVGIIEE